MGPHVHEITYEPLIHTTLYVMLLIRANPFHGQVGGGGVGGGWALEILTFLGLKWNWPNGSMQLHRAQ
jgi:hypothetical protein